VIERRSDGRVFGEMTLKAGLELQELVFAELCVARATHGRWRSIKVQ
jgi:hypothetical protein